jgi:hypothetical protein
MNTAWNLSKIPKIAHFYYGNTCLPFLRYMAMYSFAKYNPDWTIRFYKPKNLSTIEIDYVQKFTDTIDYSKELLKINNLEVLELELDYFPYNKISESHRSDYLRYEILSTIGGFYSDTDILYFKSMSDISINKEYNKDVDLIFIEYPSDSQRKVKPIGALFSNKNNKFYQEIKNKALGIFKNCSDLNHIEYQEIGATLLYNYDIKDIKEKAILLDYKSFYKHLWTDLESLFSKDVSKELLKDHEAIACHFYAGCTWVHQFIASINSNNYKNYGNTVTKLIEYILEK